MRLRDVRRSHKVPGRSLENAIAISLLGRTITLLDGALTVEHEGAMSMEAFVERVKFYSGQGSAPRRTPRGSTPRRGEPVGPCFFMSHGEDRCASHRTERCITLCRGEPAGMMHCTEEIRATVHEGSKPRKGVLARAVM